MFRRWTFWGVIGLTLYTYLGFPLLVLFRGLLRPRPVRRGDVEPTVSLVIAAHNEEASIESKLQNVLALDYPRDRLEVIVASDGSDDATNAIVGTYEAAGIRLLALPRVGKTEALNAGVAAATGEVLVFTDANSMFPADALRALVRPFADPTVGGVAGDQRYVKPEAGQTDNAGERSYWSFDRLLKLSETSAGNVISATGAIYAIRRSLFRPLPPAVTDDFVGSTGVIAQGYRLVFEPAAVAYESVAASSSAEFRRKVRVISQGLRAVLAVRELLNPVDHGFYAVQLWSHKVLRRLIVLPLLTLFAVSPSLWRSGPVYRLATLAQVGWYGAGLIGWLARDSRLGGHRLLAIPTYFALVNLAALQATIYLLTGHRIDRWEPQREAAPAAEGDLTPRPPSLAGKGETGGDLTPRPPSLRGKGEAGEDLTPRPPSLRGKGEALGSLVAIEGLSSLGRGGAGEEVHSRAREG